MKVKFGGAEQTYIPLEWKNQKLDPWLRTVAAVLRFITC